MSILNVGRVEELADHLGRPIGPSDWKSLDQNAIQMFADATGDHQWIHVDVERARRELAGPTIAHGYFLLSLIPGLAAQLITVRNKSRVLNYGSERVRYIAQVAAGSRVRLSQTVASVEKQDNGIRVVWDNVMEAEGSPRPAFVARTISLFQD